ncbi:esterase SG1-like [Leptopilina boulardi]|uniref:esterase SG1-like n=1 Tax=Leptopilina boulardi TaxID=63433 RepID=UPI0021F5F9D6|nr:esterase SG1-like [Leptopilina boulardi]
MIIILLLFSFCILMQTMQFKPRVNISQGIVEGVILRTKNRRDFSAFIGIPYGEPPVGELRFSSPVPIKKWVGTYLADNENFQIKCPQFDSDEVIGQEDCLYLNVFTPLTKFNLSNPNDSRFPVMLWIHGGAFVFGSNSFNEYGPKYFLDKDIVLVTINYRLGVFGFLTTADLVAPGNFGLKDQILALKWVQNNIESFGGDKNKVTLFGESAGGMSISFHTLSDASNGLFHQYILQSGNALSSCAYRDKTNFKIDVERVAKSVDCPMVNSTIMIKCLRNVNFKNLLKASKFYESKKPQLIWTPTNEIASKDAFLMDSPQNLVRQNKIKKYPFISGVVADEGLYVTAGKFFQFIKIV